ncbi:MAG: hypothetical protein L3K00_08365 [Thermoplasmata archaeon]|nr:hypothetical protein [Thermoplasmata archaeon]
MTATDEVGRILRATPKSYERILTFAALLAAESGSDVVVVGGSAIEVYTKGGYVSGDIDNRADRELVRRALTAWKFTDEGRLWTRADWAIAVDVVGHRYTGDAYRATTVATPYGPVHIAVVEDLFVKRLAAATHWKVRAALDEASLLWQDYSDSMDLAYLDRQATTYKVEDLLAVFRKGAPRRGGRRS